MTHRYVCLLGTFALLSAQPSLAQSGVPRRPCVGAEAPSGCDSTLPGGPQTMTQSEQPAPERRQAVARVPLHEAPPPPEAEGTVSVRPASPDAEAVPVDPERDVTPR
jgi:hypothetical protein